MTFKWIGAVLVILSCGGFGFLMAAAHRKEERTLRNLISALDYMECELQYRLTPLPELCQKAGNQNCGIIRQILLKLARELEAQIAPDVESCMTAALMQTEVPVRIRQLFTMLGRSLGNFDLSGQLKSLAAVRGACRQELDGLTNNRDVRLRGYQTLGLCAGAALAILFI